MTTLERFWSRVDKSAGEDGCWLFVGWLDGQGYGSFNSRRISAHRFAYELVVGPIPVGYQIDHLCRVRNCVKPAHLEAVTARENTRRSLSVAGTNGRKTHCIHGHAFSLENTRIDLEGKRVCRICKRKSLKAFRERKKKAL